MQVNGPDAGERERRRLASRVAELEALVYVPGLWRCPKCKFQLVQAVLSASTGTVHSHDKTGEKCPNCASPLWRVTERQAGNDMVDRCEQAVLRGRDLQAALQAVVDQVRVADDPEHLTLALVGKIAEQALKA